MATYLNTFNIEAFVGPKKKYSTDANLAGTNKENSIPFSIIIPRRAAGAASRAQVRNVSSFLFPGLSHEAEDLESIETPMTIVEPEMGCWPKDAPVPNPRLSPFPS